MITGGEGGIRTPGTRKGTPAFEAGAIDHSATSPAGCGVLSLYQAMATKTNAARILDAAGISYELRAYPVDEDDLSAPHVAAAIGMPPEQVFKTLVVRGDRTGVLMACIPGNAELNLKALAAVSGNKKVELVTVKEVLGLTGYIRGGVSPVGTRKPYPLYLDETVDLWELVAVSAGMRGLQMLVAPDDLVKAAGATKAAIAG